MIGALALCLLLLLTLPARAASPPSDHGALSSAPPPGANTMMVADASGAGETNYPLQFGRPFKAGAIPGGRCPIASYNGVPLPAQQADVKNRYPDGSVEFAVIAVVLPSIPSRGAKQTITFSAGACRGNTALTKEQMLATAFNFEAQITFRSAATAYGSPNNDQTLADWRAIGDGGFRVAVAGKTYNVNGLNFSGISLVGYAGHDNDPATVAGVVNAALATANIPAKISWYQVVNSNFVPGNAGSTIATHWVLRSTGFTGSETITALTAPAGGATDISTMLGLSAGSGPKLAPGTVQTASARPMLANGDYKLWTSGPVAQTIILADDSLNRAYDIGFGDGFHPIRPRFYATFWPATKQVSVTAVAECCLSTEVEDSFYKFIVTLGEAPRTTLYAGDLSATVTSVVDGYAKQHWAGTSWAKRGWIGGTPRQQVNLDNNIGYLASTSLIPHYDSSIDASSGAAVNYAFYQAHPHDIYDAAGVNGGLIFAGMGNGGANADIGPHPSWATVWAFSGDWRARVVGMNVSDSAADFPVHLREAAAGKRLLRSDPVGSNTGLGRQISPADHAGFFYQSEADLSSCCSYAYTPAADRITYVGATYSSRFDIATSHIPSYVYLGYLLTGDPWYLQELYFWGGITIWTTIGGGASARGPTNAEGGIVGGQPRHLWGLRLRAEAAAAAPDGDPEKIYFIEITNDEIAFLEGAFRLSGTPFDGNLEKDWRIPFGPPYAAPPPDSTGVTAIPPLGGYASAANTVGSYAAFAEGVYSGMFQTGGPSGNGIIQRGTCGGCSIKGSTLTIGTYRPDPTTGCALDGINARTLGEVVHGPGIPDADLILSCNGTPPGAAVCTRGSIPPNTATQCALSYAVPAPVSGTFPIISGTTALGNATSAWQDAYFNYVFAMTEQLGFEIGPMRRQESKLFLNLINNSSDPRMIAAYSIPQASRTAWMTSFAQAGNFYTKYYLSSIGFNKGLGSDLADYYTGKATHDGYVMYTAPGLAYAVEKGDPGAAAAWRWYYRNGYQAVPVSDLRADPKWAIVPCAGCATLPAMPTTTFAGSGPES